MKEINIEDILPIRKIENNEFVNVKNYRSIAFKIEYPEVFLQDKNWFTDFQIKLKNYIKMLPDYTVVQSLSLFDEDQYVPNYENVNNFLEKSKQFYYAQRPIPHQEDYIILTFSNKELLSGLNSHVLNSNNSLAGLSYKDAVKNMEQIDMDIDNAKSGIEVAFDSCQIRQLKDKEIALLLYKYFSLDYKYSGDNLKLPAINTELNKIGEKHIGLLSLYEGSMTESYRLASMTEPSNARSGIKQVKDLGEINQSQMFPVTIGLPFPHAYSCVIQKLPIQKVLNKINIEERVINLPATLGFPTAFNKKKHLKAFSHLITEHGFSPGNIAMTLIIPEKDKKLLNRKIELAKTAVANINDMVAFSEEYELSYLFFSNCPGNANEQYKHNLSTLINGTSFLPKERHYMSDKKGFYVTDRFGKPFLLNLLEYPTMTNKNGVIIGPSGRGKSYMLNYIVSLIYSGSHVMIIDKGGSYKKLIELFNGEYFDSDDTDNFSFSLFECEVDKTGKLVPDNLHINFVRSVLVYIWKRGNKPGNEEDACLTQLIELYYDHINKTNKTHSLIDFLDFIKSGWKDFDSKIQKFFNLDSFDLMTKAYTTGSEKNIFNATKNIDLTYKPFVAFDMKSIEKSNPTKFNLMCILITFLNIKKIQRLPRHIFKSFIIDEALAFLKGDIGEFIGNLFAEVRKENGQVLIAAQGIKYILEASKEVQEKIFANRDFIGMTNHSGYENSFKDYIELLGFSDKDIELLKSVRLQEEVFLRLGSKGMILRLETSPEEHAVFTTTPSELVTIDKLHKKRGSMEAAIIEFARLKQLNTSTI